MTKSRIIRTAFLTFCCSIVLICFGNCLRAVSAADETESSITEKDWDSAEEAGVQKSLWIKWIKVNFRWCPPGKLPASFVDKNSRITQTQGFWLAESETTQELYQAVMGNNPVSYYSGESDSYNSYVREPIGKNYPVTYVDYKEFKKFISNLNERGYAPEGFELRLPTEAEWNYACKTETSGEQNIDRIAWYFDNSQGMPHEVCSKEPNAWGLYDMVGNVKEYCFNCYDRDDKELGLTDLGTSYEETLFALKGGDWRDYYGCKSWSYWNDEHSMRETVRMSGHVSRSVGYNRYEIHGVGFRLALVRKER